MHNIYVLNIYIFFKYIYILKLYRYIFCVLLVEIKTMYMHKNNILTY